MEEFKILKAATNLKVDKFETYLKSNGWSSYFGI